MNGTHKVIHLSEAEITGYRNRSLTPAQRLAVSDHLADCETCRCQLAETDAQSGRANAPIHILQTDSASETDEAPFHLSDEQLMGYVDNQLDEYDREIVEGHLEGCERCVAEAAELRAFKALMSTYPAKQYRPTPRSAARQAPSPESVKAKRSWWSALLHPFDRPVPVLGASQESGKRPITPRENRFATLQGQLAAVLAGAPQGRIGAAAFKYLEGLSHEELAAVLTSIFTVITPPTRGQIGERLATAIADTGGDIDELVGLLDIPTADPSEMAPAELSALCVAACDHEALILQRVLGEMEWLDPETYYKSMMASEGTP